MPLQSLYLATTIENESAHPASILRKSTSGRQLPWRADDGPI